MKATQELHELGQSIWLDNITRDLLTSGTLDRYIDGLSVTGLTSNPTIFDKAIESTSSYDEAIAASVKMGEGLFFELAIDDLRAAADAFRPIHDRTNGVDGWVSLEVSPLLAYDSASTIKAAVDLHREADRPNLFIKIPGTPEGLPAIEEAIFAGVPVNVTLLFDSKQYQAAAEAYVRGIERRVEAGLDPAVGSVASVFVSRWDTAVGSLGLGVAMSKRTYAAYRELLDSDRWQRLANEGAQPQRLLWASTGVKDPNAPDTLYVTKLAAPFTVNTMPEATLLAFGDHGVVDGTLEADATAGAEFDIDVDALALELQQQGAESFDKSWDELLHCIARKTDAVMAAS
jgi:transaldolase